MTNEMKIVASNLNFHHARSRQFPYICVYIYVYIYTGCPRRNVPDFGRVFPMLNYTDITKNT